MPKMLKMQIKESMKVSKYACQNILRFQNTCCAKEEEWRSTALATEKQWRYNHSHFVSHC